MGYNLLINGIYRCYKPFTSCTINLLTSSNIQADVSRQIFPEFFRWHLGTHPLQFTTNWAVFPTGVMRFAQNVCAPLRNFVASLGGKHIDVIIVINPLSIHVYGISTYISLHLVDFYGKCNRLNIERIYHTWMVWDPLPIIPNVSYFDQKPPSEGLKTGMIGPVVFEMGKPVNLRSKTLAVETSWTMEKILLNSRDPGSPCQMMIGVYHHLLRKVFRFHYHSQKVIGSLR